MLTGNQFRLLKVQSVLFTPGLSFNGGKVLAHLMRKWGDEFTGPPFAAELPKDAPPELPHVFLQSADGTRKLLAGPLRLDAIWLAKSSEDQLTIQTAASWSSEIFQQYVSAFEGTAGRLARTAIRLTSVEKPARLLAEHFCQDCWLARPFDRPHEFEVHSLKKFTLSGEFGVNSWVRCKTGPEVSDVRNPGAAPGTVVVEQDSNTYSESTLTGRLGPVEVRKFYESAPRSLDETFSLYFPETAE